MPDTAYIESMAKSKDNKRSETILQPQVQQANTTAKGAALSSEKMSEAKGDENGDDTPPVAKTESNKRTSKSPKVVKSKHTSTPSRRKKAKLKGGMKVKATALTTASSDEDSDTDSSSNSDESTVRGKGKKSKKHKAKQKKKVSEESDSSASESDSSDSESEARTRKSKAARKSKKAAPSSDDDGEDDESATSGDSESGDNADDVDVLEMKVLKLRVSKMKAKSKKRKSHAHSDDEDEPSKKSKPKAKSKSGKAKKTGNEIYQRVDEVWDKETHRKVLKPSHGEDQDDYGEHAFLVRRRFTWENEPADIVIDIKSKVLREVLRAVLKECKAVSLEVEEPTIDPELLFMYLEELRTHYRKTLKGQLKTEKKRKAIKRVETQRSLCKALVSYLDTDFADIKKSLYPLIKAGNIDFSLAWGLFKPESIVVTSCYGHWDEPRCFQLHRVEKNENMRRGKWYTITGRYLEYDGKTFGWAEASVEIDSFKGPRPITSLDIYPLKYHQNPDAIMRQIIERGKQFVAMDGMQYKAHKGLACKHRRYMKSNA